MQEKSSIDQWEYNLDILLRAWKGLDQGLMTYEQK